MEKSNDKSNSVLTLLVLIAAIIAIVLGILVLIRQPKKEINSENKLTLEKYETTDLKEVDSKPSDFKIEIAGAYEGEITFEVLSSLEVKTYEFSAGILKDNKVVTNKYVGYKLSDIFGAMDIVLYTSLEFKDSEGYAVTMKDVTDNCYIVFKENDKDISPLMLVTNKPYEKSLENVKDLYIFSDPNLNETEKTE